MLEPILQSLREVDGVHGAMVVDDEAAVLAYRAHAIYDDISVLHQVARSVLTAVESLQLVQDDWDVLAAQFGEGKLLLRSLRTAQSRRFILTVIADANLNVAFLGVALRVAAQKLVLELEAIATGTQSGPIPVAFAADTSRTEMSSRTEMASRTDMPSRQSGSWAASSGTGLRTGPIPVQSGGIPSGPITGVSAAVSEVGVMDSASSSFLSAATKALAASVGPMAKVFVKEAVRKVCGERPFSREDGPAVLSYLATTIDDTDDRANFQRATRAL
ncbi:MAG TPA: hypothetical protein VFP84_32895 [Kofleriaceae bacterium]|nr:hypothetical protein [Kofleriaceae bacterium]